MNNITNITVNLLEYCILEETVVLPVDYVQVSIPKLTYETSSGKARANSSILINDDSCKPKTTSTILLSSGIRLKTFSDLKSSKSVKYRLINEETQEYEAYLEKGTQMIACFMDSNINDGYLTNFI